MSNAGGVLGEAVGQLYVENTSHNKGENGSIGEELKVALRGRIEKLEWMVKKLVKKL